MIAYESEITKQSVAFYDKLKDFYSNAKAEGFILGTFDETFKDNSSRIDFIGALCEMAIEEIRDQERIFSLQKLIEVAEINMTRKTDIWKEIWRKSSEAFLLISLNQKKEISEKGINYLRNLAIKYL